MTAVDPQVRMANDIAAQFQYLKPEDAAAAIANHIRTFWEPRMRADLIRRATETPEQLAPLALAATKLL